MKNAILAAQLAMLHGEASGRPVPVGDQVAPRATEPQALGMSHSLTDRIHASPVEASFLPPISNSKLDHSGAKLTGFDSDAVVNKQ